MYVGNQQFTSRNLRFINCRTAVSIHWNWGWTFKSLDIQGSEVGLSIVGDGLNVGSALVMDSRFSNTPTAILVRQPFNDGGQTNTAMIAIDNVRLENVATAAVRVNGGGVLLGGGTRTIESWGIGKKYLTTNTANGEFSNGGDINPRRSIPGGLLGGFNGGYFERSKPQYEGTPASGFTNVLNAGARGDGHSDDTAVLNRILAEQAGRTIVFFPAGTYIVTDTLFIPIGSKIVGEGWAQIMGQGARFSNIQNPYPVVKVGNPGQAGVIEIQDMMVTVRGATAGAVLMQWNVKESARGSAAMWGE